MLTARKHIVGKHVEGTMIAEQLRVEQDSIIAGVNRYRELARASTLRGEGPSLKPVERILLHWYNPLRAAIKKHQRALGKDESQQKYAADTQGIKYWGWVFRTMDAERLAVITLHEVLSELTLEPSGTALTYVAYGIGRAVVAEISLDTLRETKEDAYRVIRHRIQRFDPKNVNWYANKNLDDPVWNRKLCVQTGARLLQDLCLSANAGDYGPDKPWIRGIIHEVRRNGKKTTGFVRLAPRVLDIIEDGHQIREYLRPRYSMMVIPPLKWTGKDEGGFARIRTPLVRKLMPGQRAAMEKANLATIFDGVNALNETPWRENKPIIETEQQVWEAGGGELDIPPTHDLPWPEPLRTKDEALMKAWKREWGKVKEENKFIRGQRREFILMLDQCRQFQGYERMWSTNDLDYRTRAYPQSAHLNHYGPDRMRAVLELADAKPLTPAGTRRLKIHAANTYGIDKVPFEQRVAWVDSHMEEITESARRPMECSFWREADGGDHPWQFLACCRALADGTAAAHIPCEIDGTANAYQHYAALLRDTHTAVLVNLRPSDTPSDPYSEVARYAAAIASRDTDSTRVMEWFDKKQGKRVRMEIAPLARSLDKFICRKLAKPTTMTDSYGVTIVGARKQVFKVLTDLGYEDQAKYQAAMYASGIILDAVDEVLPAAKAAMDWLKEIARIVAQKCKAPLRWTTPLGFPVVQPHRNARRGRITTIVQSVQLEHGDDESMPVAEGEQIKGFAPNFIHSIDASHMFMVCMQARREGLAFAARHDCFITHASSMDRLAEIAREQFVVLHSQPILRNLWEEIRRMHPEAKFPEPPTHGDWDINEVLKAEYAFS